MDLYEMLMADEPTAQARAQALGKALGIREQAGLLGQLSGDKVLSGVGGSLLQSAETEQQRLGDVFRQRQGRAQAQAQLAAQQQQNTIENQFRQERATAEDAYKNRTLGLQGMQLALDREKADQDAFSAIADPVTGGVVLYNKKTGETRPLGPGGGQPGQGQQGTGPLPVIPGKPTETQRNDVINASASLSQLDLAIRALDSAPKSYGGAGNVAAGIMEGVGGETAQSLLRRRLEPNEQRAKNIVENVVSTIINERAGASVSLQEMLRQSFLPKPTDSYEQARQKLVDLKEMLGAEYKARGAGMVPDPNAAGSTPEPPPVRRRRYNPETGAIE